MNTINTENCIALDIGTSNSCVACWKDGRIKVVSDIQHSYFPSLVAINNYEVGCGDAANIYKGRKNCAYHLKRLIGKPYNDSTVQKAKDMWPFQIASSDSGAIDVILKDSKNEYRYPVNVLYSFFIRYLKNRAEDFLGHPVTQAVLTIPAVFTDVAREITIMCAEAVGLEVVNILEEPVAAAITYADDIIDNSKIMVYDFGGGTFDVCILEVNVDESGKRQYRKLSTRGHPFLGGTDLTSLWANYMRNSLQNFGIKFNESKLWDTAEKSKIDLSVNESCSVDDDLDIEEPISFTREELEDAIRDKVNETIEIVDDCLKGARLRDSDIHSVILIGGSSQIPLIGDLLSKRFTVKRTVKVEEAVAQGAMIFAASKQSIGGMKEVIIPASTNMRYVIRQPRDGIYVLIDRGVECPYEKSQEFETYRDYESFISINIGQGNSDFFSQNQLLGKLVIDEIPRRKRGEVRVVVTSSIDRNGVIHFSAKTKRMDGFPEKEARAQLLNSAAPHPHDVTLIQEAIAEQERMVSKLKCGRQLKKMKDMLSRKRDKKYDNARYFYALEQYWYDENDASKEVYDSVTNSVVQKLVDCGFSHFDAAV